MEPDATTTEKKTDVQPAMVQEPTPPLATPVGGGVSATPVQVEKQWFAERGTPVQVEKRWFAERIAFILGGGLAIGIVVLATTGEPGGFLAPLGLWGVYFMGSLLLGVGKMRREALTSEPSFSWPLFFAEFLKFAGILLGILIMGAIANAGKACSGN